MEYLVITLKQATVLDNIESIVWIGAGIAFMAILIKLYKFFKRVEREVDLEKKEGK